MGGQQTELVTGSACFGWRGGVKTGGRHGGLVARFLVACLVPVWKLHSLAIMQDTTIRFFTLVTQRQKIDARVKNL